MGGIKYNKKGTNIIFIFEERNIMCTENIKEISSETNTIKMQKGILTITSGYMKEYNKYSNSYPDFFKHLIPKD